MPTNQSHFAPRRPSAVLFDLDDTLLDRRATLASYLAGIAEGAGLIYAAATAYRNRFFELDGAGYVPRAKVFEQLCTEFPTSGTPDDRVAHWLVHAWDDCQYMEGATEILTWCRHAGLHTGIITNGRSDFQRAKIERLRLAPLMDVILVSEEEGIAKPDPQLFHRAAKQLGVAPQDCVFVGDNPLTDISGAIAAGMRAIWFERDLAWPDDAERLAHSITDLFALRSLFG